MRVRVAAVLAVAAALLPCGSVGAAPARPLRLLVGGVIVGALEGKPSVSFLARVRAGEVGAVILVGRSWSAPTMTAATARLRAAACAAGSPLLIGVDQEGGRVRRLPWAAPFESPAALGDVGETGAVQERAGQAAVALRAAGIDIDFAPVADVRSAQSKWLGSRTFSTSTALVAKLVPAFVDGLQSAGVAATAKHFPGLGNATANTDNGAVVVRASAVTLRHNLAPFRAAVTAGVQLVMISSAAYPALDPAAEPAMFSRPIVTALLRKELGFDGVVVTDALDAPPAARTPHAPARAISAGVDLLLYTGEGASEAGYTSLVADAAASPKLRAELRTAAARIDALKRWLANAGEPSCS